MSALRPTIEAVECQHSDRPMQRLAVADIVRSNLQRVSMTSGVTVRNLPACADISGRGVQRSALPVPDPHSRRVSEQLEF